MENSEVPIQSRYFESGLRVHLIDGCDRTLYLLLFGSCLLLAYEGMAIWSITAAVVLWISGRTLLRLMAKADPRWLRFFVRSLLYYSFYSAKAKYPAMRALIIARWVN